MCKESQASVLGVSVSKGSADGITSDDLTHEFASEKSIPELLELELRSLFEESPLQTSLDICVKEAIYSVLSSSFSLQEKLDQLDHCLSFLDSLPEKVLELVYPDDLSKDGVFQELSPAEAFNLMSDHVSGCKEDLQFRGLSRGYVGVDRYSLAHSPVRSFFSERRLWSSVTTQRILFQSLVVWEAVNFARVALSSKMGLWQGLKVMLLSGNESPGLSINAIRRSVQIANSRFAILLTIMIAVSILAVSNTHLMPSSLSSISGWISFVLFSLAIVMLGIELFNLIYRVTFGRRAAKNRRENLKLAIEMVSFASRICQMRSPKEAEFEFLRLSQRGAVWPADAWVMLSQLLSDSHISWGYEILGTYTPRYKSKGDAGGDPSPIILDRAIEIVHRYNRIWREQRYASLL